MFKVSFVPAYYCVFMPNTGDRCNEHLYPNLPEEPLDAVEPRSENTRAAEPPSTVAPPSKSVTANLY